MIYDRIVLAIASKIHLPPLRVDLLVIIIALRLDWVNTSADAIAIPRQRSDDARPKMEAEREEKNNFANSSKDPEQSNYMSLQDYPFVQQINCGGRHSAPSVDVCDGAAGIVRIEDTKTNVRVFNNNNRVRCVFSHELWTCFIGDPSAEEAAPSLSPPHLPRLETTPSHRKSLERTHALPLRIYR